jgi:hypothetical protein
MWIFFFGEKFIKEFFDCFPGWLVKFLSVGGNMFTVNRSRLGTSKVKDGEPWESQAISDAEHDREVRRKVETVQIPIEISADLREEDAEFFEVYDDDTSSDEWWYGSRFGL